MLDFALFGIRRPLLCSFCVYNFHSNWFCCTMSLRSRCDCTGSLALHKCASRFPLMLRLCDVFVFGSIIFVLSQAWMLSVALSIATLFVTITLKSSAYPKLSISDIHSGRSLINSRKWRGPRIDPWGTPLVTFLSVDFAPLICTYCLRWLKYDFRSPKIISPIPRDLILLFSTLCGTVSKTI